MNFKVCDSLLNKLLLKNNFYYLKKITSYPILKVIVKIEKII